MSGGSYDYAYCTVQNFAADLESATNAMPPGEDRSARLAFVQHCRAVADAMRAVEWVDSSDYGIGDEVDPIRKCLQSGAEVEAAVKQAREALAALAAAIGAAEGCDDAE